MHTAVDIEEYTAMLAPWGVQDWEPHMIQVSANMMMHIFGINIGAFHRGGCSGTLSGQQWPHPHNCWHHDKGVCGTNKITNKRIVTILII